MTKVVNNMRIKLIAMDLDGTITQHKSKLDDFNKQVLDSLRMNYKLLLVGAGSCSRIYEQLDRYPIDIIGNYGMQLSEIRDGELIVTQNETSEVDIDEVTKNVDILREEWGYTNYIGETIEIHPNGMLTFPLLGTNANLTDKLAFDPTREKRRPMLQRVREVFNRYTVFVGGSSSFDIVPKPYNKLYALENYIRYFNIKKSDVVYIGDDYGHGGNDEHIYLSDINFICVDDYLCFSKACENLLKEVLG